MVLGDLYVAFEQLKGAVGARGAVRPRAQEAAAAIPENHRHHYFVGGRGGTRHAPYPPRTLAADGGQAPRCARAGNRGPAGDRRRLRYANRYKVADLIITGRGGGSIEDLWAFNDERVAHAIYESEIPVISAVGHEPDVTIADYVADARASTPSNAAEIAVPDRNDVRARLTALERGMTKTEESRLSALRERLTALERKRVLRDPMAFIADKRLLLDYTQKSLASLAEKQVGERRQRFAALCASLHAMSPLAVLARGYAVARTANGTVLRSADEVTVGETIDVTLGRGSLACTVNETRGGNNHGKKL